MHDKIIYGTSIQSYLSYNIKIVFDCRHLLGIYITKFNTGNKNLVREKFNLNVLNLYKIQFFSQTRQVSWKVQTCLNTD